MQACCSDGAGQVFVCFVPSREGFSAAPLKVRPNKVYAVTSVS